MPEPLTPTDCDLRGMPFMPVDIVRVFDSDLYALSTGEEFKAAFTLWGKSFLQVPAASLPSDDRILAHLSGAGARWGKVKAMALRGWVLCTDGRLYHPVVAEKALEAWASRQAQRARTEAARAARAAQRQANEKQTSPTTTENVAETVTEHATDTATVSVTENGSDARNGRDTGKTRLSTGSSVHDAAQQGDRPSGRFEIGTSIECSQTAESNGSRPSVTDTVTASKGQGQGQGQGIKKETSLRSVASQAPPITRGSRLLKDWQPQTAERDMARSLGLDCDAVLERFRDYWIAKPGKGGVKLDWDATFRNWLRNEAPRGRSAAAIKPKTATSQWADELGFGDPGPQPRHDIDGHAEEVFP